MKRVIVTQYGKENILYERQFVLELPDEADVYNLDDRHLAWLADEADVEWMNEHCTGIESEGHDVEDEEDDLPVVRWADKAQASLGHSGQECGSAIGRGDGASIVPFITAQPHVQ